MKTDAANNTKRPAFTGPDLCAMEAHEVVALLQKRAVSPLELLDAAFKRVKQVEPQINAMPTLCEDRARAAAKTLMANSSRRNALLSGLPLAIKDLTLVAGVRSTFGTIALKDFIPDASDPTVERIEGRGGVVIGKTNTPEMGAGGNTFNSVFGATRNPWNTRMNAGGSSGGAAASLASGEVWLSHGSDLAGSLRTPAAYCGIIGFRPTPGRCGGGPAAIAYNQEAVQGPMARTITDTALFLDAMVGFDPRQPLTFDAPAKSFRSALQRLPKKPRIAYSPTLNGFAEVEPEIDGILQNALLAMEKAGAIVAMECPALPELYNTYVTLRAMTWAALPGRLPDIVQANYKRTLRENIEVGRKLTPEKIFDAQRARSVIYENMRAFLTRFDVLACPVVGLEPQAVEIEYPAFVNGKPVPDYIDWLRFSFLATSIGLPALSIPVGFTKSGMPVGMQLIGQPRGEARLLQIGRAFELCLGALGRMPIDPVVR